MLRPLSSALCVAALIPLAAAAQDAAPAVAPAEKPAAEAPAQAAAEPLAATIDGTLNVTVAEVDAMAEAMSRSQGMGPGGDAAQVRERAIDQLVMQKLLLRAADAANVQVPATELDQFFKERLPPGATLAQVAEREGVTEAKIREDVLGNLRINKLIETQFTDIPAATDDELKAAFDEMAQRRPDFATVPEQVEARHILLKVEEGASAEDRAAARKKLEDIRTRIVDGKEDFAKLAAEFSDCPSGKQNGGNLGTFGRGRMVKPFEDAAFGQEPNVVGGIVETDFGFHIVEVLKKTAAGQRTVESERERLAEMVTGKKKNEIAKSYIEGLKTAAKVEILEKPVPAAEEPAPKRELPVWAQ